MSKRWKCIVSLMLLVVLGVGGFYWSSIEKEQRLKTYLEVAIVDFDKELTIEGSANLLYAMPKVTTSKLGKAITEVVENERNSQLATIIYPEKIVNPLIGDNAYCVAIQRYQSGILSDHYVTKGVSHYLYLTEKGQKLTLEDIITDK